MRFPFNKAHYRFESRNEQLAPFRIFLGRLGFSVLVAAVIVFAALLIGILGYHYVAKLHWIDALLDASMILTGMGPVNPMTDTPAKLFASAYALFSGVVFLSSMALILAPAFHRLIHKFHLGDEEVDERPKPAGRGKR